MNRLPDRLVVGVIANIVCTAIGLLAFALFYASFKHTTVTQFFSNTFAYPDNTIKVLGLTQILSIPLFYLFINRHRYNSAKGIILMFLLMAITTVIVKLM